MPAKSKAQQMAAGVALAAKRGEAKKSELKGASKSMVESMTEREALDRTVGAKHRERRLAKVIPIVPRAS